MSVLSRRTLLRAAGLGGLVGGAAAGGAAAGGCDLDEPAVETSPLPVLGLSFPDGFAWGVATSAYQIEGAAAEDGRTASIWDTFSHSPGNTRDGDTGDTAADHYHRWQSDLDLMRELGLRAYRFSIAWPRIIPDGTGAPNPKGIDFYRRLVDGLHQRGIAPVATLYHWDLPQVLQDRGGWENRDCAKWFADYATVMFRALGTVVPTWLTINEPKTIATVGYRMGAYAPGRRDAAAAARVTHHLLLAHGLAVQAFRSETAGSRIGVALNLAPVYPADGGPRAAAAATYTDGLENRLYLDPILRGRYPDDAIQHLPAGGALRASVRDGDLAVVSSTIDVLGVQYYTPVYVDAAGRVVTIRPTSLASWQQIYPTGLYDLLTRLRRDYGDIPLVITENGVPQPDRISRGGRVEDPRRITFLRDHLVAAHRAIQTGVRLEGYHVWSLLDNFEWAEGYAQRWGLVYVDYATQGRTPKSSARWYSQVIARNGI